jgi:serine/threonine protein kinase
MSATKHLEDAVFFTALHVTDPAHRQLFLDQACADNPSLRQVVEEMLNSQEDADLLIDRGFTAVALTVQDVRELPADGIQPAPAAQDDQIGKRIGRYTILECLGKGGCGAVYLAEQEDPVKRLVALKIIKLGMDTRSVIARFDVERQALAMMDHPNIARVLDAGATDAGRPFFVLELVRGTQITEFCDSNRYDVRQRLDLFIQVCRAIQHAHQKGVIHRDIKPSNVLVAMHDGVPVPKVIDFGIAKAIEGRLATETLHTHQEHLLGTPAYMSPEQAALGGLDVDTRSDVYALGVLLYELLVGRPPFDARELSAAGPDEMRRILREREALRPSALLGQLDIRELKSVAAARQMEPGKLVSQIKGDLDWIAMKALEKDRARRYETALGLAMDVKRFLGNEAIVARPPGRVYLLGKLVRRHAVFFAAGSIAVAALVAGLATSMVQYRSAKQAEIRQSELRELAEKALANEAILRREAESREKLTEAVILLRQDDYDGAAKALASMQDRPRRPSLDGVTALRAVGEWLAIHGRWHEAAERYLWLLEIDKLDPWGPVTLDTQACGVVLVEDGDAAMYRQFCEDTIKADSSSYNGDAIARILKTCLLLPPDAALWTNLQPLGQTFEEWLTSSSPGSKSEWSAIPACLWRYRGGQYDKVIEIAQPISTGGKVKSAVLPTVQAIYAMTLWQRGEADEARNQLAKARDGIARQVAVPMARGDSNRGLWYDWLFAKIMVREATQLIGEAP